MAKTALITGASSGIGLELARLMAADGINLVLVSRNAELLEQLAAELRESFGIQIRVLIKDLAHPKAPDVIFDELLHDNIVIDYLVNNAGFGTYGKFVELDLAEELELLQVNIVSLTHLTKLFAREMVKRGSGKILNVGSSAGFQPGPMMSVYYASKAFVLHFSEALRNELHGTGVTVTCLAPGTTRTQFHIRARTRRGKLARLLSMGPKPVAVEGYRAMLKGKPLVVSGWVYPILVQARRVFPRRFITFLSRRVLDP